MDTTSTRGRVAEGTDSGDSELEESLEPGALFLSREEEVFELTVKVDSEDEGAPRIDNNERGPSEEVAGATWIC